ncbi:hypothetical protein NIES2104_26960 [Leptolyngbya sp. NIES-2104]|nr:hypothetical protein NIES2104_26960 [Leptolyngbya sp. NIES-2104]
MDLNQRSFDWDSGAIEFAIAVSTTEETLQSLKLDSVRNITRGIKLSTLEIVVRFGN